MSETGIPRLGRTLPERKVWEEDIRTALNGSYRRRETTRIESNSSELFHSVKSKYEIIGGTKANVNWSLTEGQKAVIKLFDAHSRIKEALDFLPTAAEHLVEAGKSLNLAEIVTLGYVLRHASRVIESVQSYLELRYLKRR